MTRPLVSFVVPCYRLARYLPDCIESLLAQTYSEFEILVLDNASPDETPEVASSFRDERLTYIRRKVNIGAQANFNDGIMRAHGDLVWVLSADDALVGTDTLDAYVDAMSDPSVAFAFSRGTHLGTSTVVDWADLGRADEWFQPPDLLRRLLVRNCIVMSSVIARRDALIRVGMYRTDLPHAADWYLWCQLARSHPAVYLAKPMVAMRVHDGTLSAALAEADPHAFVNDELAVAWSLRGELAGEPDLRGICDEAIAARLAGTHGSRLGDPGASSDATVEAIERHVRARLSDEHEVRALVGLALQRSGDFRLTAGDTAGAVRAYRLSTTYEARRLRVHAKLALARAGRLGLGARHLACRMGALRRSR